MYMHVDVARQMRAEMLEEAQRHRNSRLVRSLHRARRRQERAERQMRQARLDASRVRRQLEAGL